MSNEFTLHLNKENFKFSAAHFLIFDSKKAERLHGHNYQVRMKMTFSGNALNENGYLIDFHDLKVLIKRLVDDWDERVLLPRSHPEIKTEIKGTTLFVEFRDRQYAFPASEVLLLPITNTSVEQLSRLFAEILTQNVPIQNWKSVEVEIEETRGQSSSYKIAR